MDSILTQLEKQTSCTPASGLYTFLLILRVYLEKPYPDRFEKPLKCEYDIIVVGGGTSGCVVASRLSENKHLQVLVVEAGGWEPDITKVPGIAENDALGNTSIDWHYRTVPHPEYCGGRPCYLPRAKVMGGCDSHNEMWYLVPNRRLHDEMTKRGIEGWSYEEMLPYYRRRSHAREKREDGTDVDMSIERFPYEDQNINIVQEAYKEMGFTHPSSNGDFEQDYKMTAKNGERVSSNSLYIDKIRRNRPNLDILTQSYVTKILLDKDTKAATGVELYRTEGGKRVKMCIKARKEVIVCGGIINTPQLLQLSGIGPKEVLEPLGIEVITDLPVGRNFQNHASFSGTTVTLTTTSTVPRDCDSLCKDVKSYVTNRSGRLSGGGPYTNYLIFNSSHATREYPDLMMSLVPSITGMNLPDHGFSMCYYNKISTRIMTTRAASQGSITIKSKDPFIYPDIILGYSESEKKRVAEGCAWAHKIANSEAFKKNGIIANNTGDPRCKDMKYGTYEYFMCAMKGHMQFWHHGMSSCSMGPKGDPVAVVDSRCKVLGIKGLRIIDASIIPVLPNVNPNALVLAAAERCSEFVKEDYACCNVH